MEEEKPCELTNAGEGKFRDLCVSGDYYMMTQESAGYALAVDLIFKGFF